MRDLAMALSNDTATVQQDVDDIFAFEKEIAGVGSDAFSLVSMRDTV